MEIRYFSLIIGLLFLAIGMLRILPHLVHPPSPGAPEMAMKSGYEFLFGLFPVNVLHNLVHLLIGGGGILAFRAEREARWFAQSLTGIYGVLAVMGLIPFSTPRSA